MPTYTTTVRHALRRLVGTNVISDIDAGIAALADDVDSKMATADAGPLASRPVSSASTPGVLGRLYRVTDRANRIDFDHGTGWITLGSTGYENVTALPASPNNGDAINLLVSGNLYPARYVTSLVEWVVENVEANAPLFAAEATAAAQVLAASWAAYGGPTLTIPAKMDALIKFTATLVAVGNNEGQSLGALALNAEANPPAPWIRTQSASGAQNSSTPNTVSAELRQRRTGLVSGDILRSLSYGYTTNVPGSSTTKLASGRTISVFPTRFRA